MVRFQGGVQRADQADFGLETIRQRQADKGTMQGNTSFSIRVASLSLMSPADYINQPQAANKELDGKIARLLYLKDLSNISSGKEGLPKDCNPARKNELRIEEG